MDWQAKRLEGKVITVRFIDSAGRSNERRDRVKDRNTYICGDCPSWRLFFLLFSLLSWPFLLTVPTPIYSGRIRNRPFADICFPDGWSKIRPGFVYLQHENNSYNVCCDFPFMDCAALLHEVPVGAGAPAGVICIGL